MNTLIKSKKASWDLELDVELTKEAEQEFENGKDGEKK